MVNLWRKHYFDLINCVNDSSMERCEYECDMSYDEIVVTVDEVTIAFKKLGISKACWSDKALLPSMCFTSFNVRVSVVSGTSAMMKDKAGKISSKDNYRPIALY